MTETQKSKAIEYAESIYPPAELLFFGKEQMDKLALERQKMERSRVFVKSILEKDDFEQQLQKAELEGRVYGPSQMSSINIRFRALEQGIGDRTDLKDTLISKTGQRIIMSGRLQTILGFIADGYMLADESEQLISALQADGVPGPEIDRVNAALNQYGAIIMQRGIFSALKMMLEEAIGKSLPLYSASSISSLSNKPVSTPVMPEHGASLEALKQKLVSPQAPVSKPTGTLSDLKKEIDREVNTPELPQPKETPALSAHVNPKPVLPKPVVPPAPPIKPLTPSKPQLTKKFEMPDLEPMMPIPDKLNPLLDQDAAWRISNRVVAPKITGDIPVPQAGAVPKVRNRVSRHGLADINQVKQLNDLSKIEAAHLRQGPLAGQIQAIKNKIADLARQNDMLPVSLLPKFVQSPLFQTYLKAGALMIDRNLTGRRVVLDNIMAELESQGEDILSQEEFEAVADMKKELESMSGL